MFYFESKDFESKLSQNTIISKKIEIDKNLDCFIVIDCHNQKIINPILNKIVDFIIDNVTSKDTYNKFLVTLEWINYFINSLKNKNENLENLNILIWILEKNNFHFSKIWESSVWLINKKQEFLEISDRKTSTLNFDYISSWKLDKWEKIILSNNNFFIHLTENDLKEISEIEENEEVLENILEILNDEKVEENYKIQLIQFENKEFSEEKNQYLEKSKDIFYKMLDNNFSKTIIVYFEILKEKLDQKSKLVKNLVFIWWISLSTFLLFYVISGIIWTTIETSKTNEFKTNLIEARTYVRLASENLTNDELFEKNILKAEEILNTVKEKKLFLTDIENINQDISIIKKQFYWIETFNDTTENLVFKWDFKDSVKILDNNKKTYVLTKNSIYWPIISWQNIKNYVFNELQIDDEFIDASANWNDIMILTKKWRVVRFAKNWSFSYSNVLGQTTWQNSKFIETYNLNLYMLNNDWSQVYKHSPSWNNYMEAEAYLNENDSKNIKEILSIWIDGWIYMLKDDLTLYKFFSRPKYELRNIVLNNLPKNYNLEDRNVKIITWNNYLYFYMYLNNKIWIFQANTKRFADVKSLTYIWQIEGKNSSIKSFFVPRDWEIQVLLESWIHKINFEVKDERLIVR